MHESGETAVELPITFFAERPQAPEPIAPAQKGRFHAMAKRIGSTCNIDCTYCYYLHKEHLLEQHRGRRMGPSTLERYIRQYIEAQNGDEVIFSWQGGEPTMLGLDFFRDIVEIQKRYTPPGRRISNDLQTNGTLLDDAWCAFLKEHDFLVGLSIDGPRELHDAMRVDRKGRPTFDSVMRGAGTATQAWRAIQYADRREPDQRQTAHRRLSLPAQRARLDLYPVHPLWYKKDVGRVLVNLFETAVVQTMGRPSQTCITAGFCGKALAIEHDGEVYSCDHYVYPDYALGNIGETHIGEMAFSARQQKFGYAKRDALPAYCRDCKHLKLCWGECPKNRFIRSPDGEAGLNYLCAGIRKFHDHAGPMLRQLAAHSG